MAKPVERESSWPDLEKRLSQLEVKMTADEQQRNKPVVKKLVDKVVEYKGTALLLTLCLFAAGILINRYLARMDESASLRTGNQIDKKLEPVNSKLDSVVGTSTRLEATLNTLQPFVSDLVHQEMERASRATPAAFSKDLRKIGHTFQAARVSRISSNADVQANIGASLTRLVVSNADLPFLWDAASSFASYRSEVSFPVSLPSGLPDCIDVTPTVFGKFPPPEPDPRIPNGGTLSTIARPYVYSDCQIDLSELPKLFSIQEHMTLRDRPGGSIQQIIVAPDIFDHVLVTYNGESLPNVPLTFRECLFRFQVKSQPPPRGRTLLIAVMQNDPRGISLPAKS